MATGDTNTSPRRRGTDWVAARDFYLALDPPRSYQDVAEQFTVSRQRVRFVAKRDGWEKQATEIDRAAFERVKRSIVRSREERNKVYLAIVDAVFDKALEKLGAGDLEVRLGDLPQLGKHAELIEGEATDRIARSEVTEAFNDFVRLLAPFVPRSRQKEFQGVVRQYFGLSEERA